MKHLLILIAILATVLAACQAVPTSVPLIELKNDYYEQEQSPQAVRASEPERQKSENDSVNLTGIDTTLGYFGRALARFSEYELVTMDGWTRQTENLALLDEWVENYRLGIPGKVAILIDGGPFPSNFFILESDGNATYSVTAYFQSLWLGESDYPPRVFESSHVIMSAYRYTFGADTPDLDEVGLIDNGRLVSIGIPFTGPMM
ncbi:MAG: hypothetical protein FWE19_06450 [Oscillospiraceae bacterium]|nr:hypothetical protein [Oscillospiraceae bacterium]